MGFGSIAKESIKKGFHKVGGVTKVASATMPFLFGAMTYANKKEEGASTLGALGYAVADRVMSNTMGLPYMALQFALHAPSLAIDAAQGLGKLERSNARFLNNSNQVFGNANFMDNQQIATMRQAGMALAEQSKYNIQQALMGNEARYMHR